MRKRERLLRKAHAARRRQLERRFEGSRRFSPVALERVEKRIDRFEWPDAQREAKIHAGQMAKLSALARRLREIRESLWRFKVLGLPADVEAELARLAMLHPERTT